MCTPNSKSVAVAIPERCMKFKSFTVGQCDLDYVSIWPTFVLLIFYSMQSICMINLNSVALAVWEICTGVRKFKPRSPKLGHVSFVLVFACPQKYSSTLMRTLNLKFLSLAVPKIANGSQSWGALAARGLRQVRAQTSTLCNIVLDFKKICPIFKSERSECEWGRKRGKISHFLTSCKK